MKQNFIIATFVALGFSGCTSSMNHLLSDPIQPTQTIQTTPTEQYAEQPSAAKTEAYESTMRKIAAGIQHDTKYQRIALDTPETKAWFKNITYKLWDRQITRYQFMTEGLSKYPTHKYEFEFIIKGFTFN